MKTKMKCKWCGGDSLVKYGVAKRIIKCENGKVRSVDIQKFLCKTCNHVVRKSCCMILPYKHYRKDIVLGFIFGTLSMDDLDFELYPCESTIRRWKKIDIC